MLRINLLGTFVMSQEVLHVMPQGGRIVNIASRGYLGGAGASHYVASKAAVVGLTRAMATELRWEGINVNCIAPGFIQTEMTEATADRLGVPFADFAAAAAKDIPVARVGQPEDIAALTSFLTSDESGFVNGQIIYSAGGPKT